MFGFQDGWISCAYLLTIMAALTCVTYGLINWNKGDDGPDEKDSGVA